VRRLRQDGLRSRPFTGNRYAFGGGNPVSFVEIDGHWGFSFSDIGHAVLDVAGLVPVVGEVADVANGIWYAAEGNYVDAALSFASAIPVAGYGASAAKAVRYGDKAVDAARTVARQGDNIADAGRTIARTGDDVADAARAAPTPKDIPTGKPAAGTPPKVDPAPKPKPKPAPKPAPAPAKAAGDAPVGPGSSCTRNSFTPDTPVLMADGTLKPIAAVRVGDQVLATDPPTGRTEAKPVVALITGAGPKDLVEITVDTDGARGSATGKVIATDGHPFWIDNFCGWIDADNLRRGDLLRTPEGRTLEVVATRSFSEHRRVFNLTVEGLHTYYVEVGDADILVHNTQPDFCPIHDNLGSRRGPSGSIYPTREQAVQSAQDYARRHANNCTYRAECAAGNHVHVDKATGRKVWVEIRGQLRKVDETVPHHYYWGQSCPFCGRPTG
jgi:Pretoxin HINT domain